MPKKVIHYECEICGRRYKTKQGAVNCEKRGTGINYPIGCIYGDHTRGMFYHNITFAIATNRVDRHTNLGSSWACRDNGAGDSLGLARCGGNSLRLTDHDGKISQYHPTFKRMVKWLESQKIPVTVWDGERAVLLEEWLNSR